MQTIPVEAVKFVKELYPRLREDDAAIERYRSAIDRLPPIVVARDGVLVDGFHRWQAFRREGLEQVPVVDLGNLTDVEIFKESIRRNASHGRQLETSDKKRNADLLYRQGTRDIPEIAELLSITENTATEYIRNAKRDEKQAQRESAWDRWLNCESYREIADSIGVEHTTVRDWCGVFSNALENTPPASRQHFDVWQFQRADGDSSYFGRMPLQVVENLLWLYTEPGQIVLDPFVGGGTTIDVAKRMGRRVWASDRKKSTPTLPIHEHDIQHGWPEGAPHRVDFILLDPPYWKQAAGRYSNDAADLGNMPLDDFMRAWAQWIRACQEHLTDTGHLAFIVSPAEDRDTDTVVDLAYEMTGWCTAAGLKLKRRIIVPYTTQQATGQQVEWAREHRKLLKLYRDLVVFTK